jgi:hypothetical protein
MTLLKSKNKDNFKKIDVINKLQKPIKLNIQIF